MKQRLGVRFGFGATAAVAASLVALLQAGPAFSGARLTVPGGPFAEEGGFPPPVFRLQAIVARAWEDSKATWSRRIQSRAIEVESVNLRFVPRLLPANCYGLYSGDGPAYCSGNQTVFVGTAAANKLMTQFGAQGEAGITFLIGHEFGHHIQNLHGRFHLLSQAIYSAPDRGPDLVRRFELEADCLAGVWLHDSDAWANSSQLRSDMLLVLASIGDEKTMAGQAASVVASKGLHGTTEQRTRWFLYGVEKGNIEACDVLNAPQP
jgi:predicted metalloprotease